MKLKAFLKKLNISYHLNNQLADVELAQVSFCLAHGAIEVVDAMTRVPVGEIQLVKHPRSDADQSWLVTTDTPVELFAKLQGRVIQYLQWEDQLSQALSYKHPVTQILRVLQEAVANPVLIFDSSLKLLGHSTGDHDLGDWESSVAAGYISVTAGANQALVRLLNSSATLGGQVCQLPGFHQPFFLQEVVLRNNDHFYLIIVVADRDLLNEDRATIAAELDKIAATVGLHNFPYQSQGGNLEGLLRDILVRPNISISEVQNRLQFDPHQLVRPLRVLCIKTPSPNVQPVGTILTKFVTFHYDRYDVYVIENSSPVVVKTIIQELTPYLKRNDTCAGLSNSFTRLHQFNQFYQQAVRAIKLGKAVGLNQYGDYIASDLIDHIRQDQSLTSYLSRDVLELRRADPKLFATLRTFLVNRENKKQTALDLGIHRSTLDYRLNKLEDQYHIQLTTPDQYLYTLLSVLLAADQAL
ncbi:PucR family transcriptional regulator [Limosilactobacillus sp.]|uniref:PucR family transcriptional regulator n=1 Tax=Limosilactobacillus sp. TaxID=2773925 RepID=UPI003F0F529B